jgi:gamma-glutamylcyclotransferase (GGCT)/AIG2-like uncharacterized protein YtfP
LTGGSFYIFFYGSLMNRGELQKVGINVNDCKPAVLNDYMLTFNKESVTRCIAANLVCCPISKVYGIVCKVDSSIIEKLDQRETGYVRKRVNVQIIDSVAQDSEGNCVLKLGNTVSAETYISYKVRDCNSISCCVSDSRFSDYLEIIAEGLKQWYGSSACCVLRELSRSVKSEVSAGSNRCLNCLLEEAMAIQSLVNLMLCNDCGISNCGGSS